ncbi:hypothetical protein F2Q69_00001416 [Brassica cretica]|uniref:Uncharacterized protein n=1 Tax=Brassica cretica TaxID=69181 RepID=A0A8S9PGB9_BRACR|nr:hypothetical protein F2Q69_00001416 [Brassica cretica]
MENFFAFNPPPAKQAERGITAAGSHQQTDPPDLFPGQQNTTKTTQINPDHPMVEESLIESDEFVLEPSMKQDIWEGTEKYLSHGQIPMLNLKPQETLVLFVQPAKATISPKVLTYDLDVTYDLDEALDAVAVARCSKHTRTKIHVHKEFALNATQRKQLMYEVFHFRRPPELLSNNMDCWCKYSSFILEAKDVRKEGVL